MNTLLGVVRLFVVGSVLLVGFLVVMPASLLPVRIRRASLALWIVLFMSRVFLWVFRVQVHCSDVDRLRRHEGFIFPNHHSYLESLIFLSITPVRFLAAIEVSRRPVTGLIARAIGTIFVARNDRQSRVQARLAITRALKNAPYPPVVLYPEGKLGPGEKLNPFRFGAFEMAAENSIPFLPVAVHFDPIEVAVWRGGAGESLMDALWRLARYTGPVRVKLTLMATYHPSGDDDARQIALMTQSAIAQELQLPVAEVA